MRLLPIALILSATVLAQVPPPQQKPAAMPEVKPVESGPVPSLPEFIPADAVRYAVLGSGKLAGHQAIWKTPDGSLHVFYQYNDRGRGPAIHAVYKLDAKSVPTAARITGNDYFKGAVEETFSNDGKVARWKNKAEQGESAARGVYVSFNGPPEELAILARALLASGGRMPLLPAGDASIERVREVEVAAGGRRARAVLYAVSGLGFSPAYLWLDDRNDFFAAGSSWQMHIREGWESAAEQLTSAQREVAEARLGSLAEKLARKPKGAGLLIHNVALFDPDRAGLVPSQTVVVEGNRITAVRAASPADRGTKYEFIDGTGKTLLPGLWDMHVHADDLDGILHLAAGVTSVRDLANDTDELLARIKKFDSGGLIGPRVVAAGFIDGPGPYQGPTKILAGSEQEARKFVADYDKLGFKQIKIYSSLRPEIVPAIIDEAHKRGMRVSGHIPAQMTAEQLVRMGMDEIQHANFLLLNFMPDVKETRTPARFTAPAARGAEIAPRSPQVTSFLDLLKKRQVVIDPTLNIFEAMFTARPGQVMPGTEAIADRLPAQVRRGLLGGGLPVPEGKDQRYRDSFQVMKNLIAGAHREGITIVAGTDALPGFSLHRELEIYGDAGIPAGAVLRIATLGAARVAGRERELGSVAVGKLADLVLIEGDPTMRLRDIRRARLVVKDGILYDPAELYQAIGVLPE